MSQNILEIKSDKSLSVDDKLSVMEIYIFYVDKFSVIYTYIVYTKSILSQHYLQMMQYACLTISKTLFYKIHKSYGFYLISRLRKP